MFQIFDISNDEEYVVTTTSRNMINDDDTFGMVWLLKINRHLIIFAQARKHSFCTKGEVYAT